MTNSNVVRRNVAFSKSSLGLVRTAPLRVVRQDADKGCIGQVRPAQVGTAQVAKGERHSS